jgi:hypothetical protein
MGRAGAREVQHLGQAGLESVLLISNPAGLIKGLFGR